MWMHSVRYGVLAEPWSANTVCTVPTGALMHTASCHPRQGKAALLYLATPILDVPLVSPLLEPSPKPKREIRSPSGCLLQSSFTQRFSRLPSGRASSNGGPPNLFPTAAERKGKNGSDWLLTLLQLGELID
jgi:hypothetical protein